MKKLDKKLLERLKAYSLTAGAIAAGSNVGAAIVYTDIIPDFNGGSGSQYFLDLNNDAINDFRIYHNGGNSLYIEPLNSNAEVLGSGGTGYAYPYALNSGDPIDASQSSWLNNGFSTGNLSMNYGSCAYGSQWCTLTDKYLGLRFQVGSNTYYGWARLDVNANGSSWVVKDYAYDDVAGTAIAAGATVSPVPANSANNVLGADVNNNSNGSDLQVTFDAGANESTINEYRVMVVKDANASSFDLVAAQGVVAANYTAVTPIALSTYTQTLASTANDVTGLPIVNNEPYRVFVLSIADGTNANTDSLSLESNLVTLTLPTANSASNVVASDVSDNSNGTDLEVTFDAGASENTISEYRAMAVKSANVGSFDLTAAQAVIAGNYMAVTPNASPNYTQAFGATGTDVDGTTIANGQPYQIFILSIADGTNAVIDSLSSVSNAVTLHIPPAPALNITAADIDDNGNGSDLEISFDSAANQSTVLEYRVMVVKEPLAASFDLAASQAVSPANYSSVTPSTVATYTEVLGSSALDTDGDPIQNGVAYKAFIFTKADGTNAELDTLSQASNAITLHVPISLASAVVTQDIDDQNSGSDLEVTFSAAADETTLGEYRILVVKTANAGTFNAATASGVIAGNYFAVAPDGSASYTNVLSGSANDVDGDPIAIDVPYTTFILSVADGVNSIEDGLSAPSASTTLNIEVNTASLISGLDIADNLDGSDIQVDFVAAPQENEISEYRAILTKSGTPVDLATASSLPADRYSIVAATGTTTYQAALDAGQTDADGDAIVQQTPYQIQILSIANGTDANIDALSTASEEFMVKDILGIASTNELNAEIFVSNNAIIIRGLNGDGSKVKVYNAQGQLAYVNDNLKGTAAQIELSNAAAGIYVVVVSQNEKATSKRVLLD